MIDLDSHLMEPRDYLLPFAPASLSEQLTMAGAPSRDEMIAGSAGQWSTPGAFDRSERRALLDRLGIQRQVVLPGISHVAHLGTLRAVESARAQHRAATAWADGDPRFCPAAVIPMDHPGDALDLIGDAADDGFRLVLMTSGRSQPVPPNHPAQARIWHALAESGLVGVLHFGTTGAGLSKSWRTLDAEVGDDAADPMDVVVAHHGVETMIARMALSGMLGREQAPKLLLAEHGAGWLPGFLTSLDACQRAFRRLDPLIPQGEPLSAQVRRAITVVPFAFEPVGDLIDRIGPDVLGFATDHPHPEGGRDPVATFGDALGTRDSSAFFNENGTRLLDR